MYDERQREVIADFPTYNEGECDQRPWGYYEVLGVGSEAGTGVCQKKLKVKPFSTMSLQRHRGRSEMLQVETGTMTLLVDGKMQTHKTAETIIIPKGAVHCIMNLSNLPLVISEKQIGICREEDNDRICDIHGRKTVPVTPEDAAAQKSIELYTQITGLLGKLRRTKSTDL